MDFTPALDAISSLAQRDLDESFHGGQMAAVIAHDEIELAPINRKSAIFYQYFLPLRGKLISLLADSYRRYFKVALAHRREAGASPEQWAWNHLQSAVGLTMEWIRDWYILACDGENQSVRHTGQIPYAPGQTVSLPIPLTVPPLPPESWRAPAWLFAVAPTLGFIRPLKTKHVPAIDSEEKLGAAHTRLLLKLARRVFLWALETAIEKVWNEEIAAAGAIPAEPIGVQIRQPNKRKSPVHHLKGIEGLTSKHDLSRYSQYMDNLTEKQQLAFSLKFEYELGLAQIASRMGIDRKTADEHIKAANKKISQNRSSEKRKVHRAKSTPEP
jgi:DNA-directed RNA polymerase specialized sigma24 family protein